MARPTGTARLARRLGARIRALRTEAGLTQERLAWDCDLAKPYLSQIEAGKRLPSVGVLALIARRLNCELSDIVALDPAHLRLRVLEATRGASREAVDRALAALVGK